MRVNEMVASGESSRTTQLSVDAKLHFATNQQAMSSFQHIFEAGKCGVFAN